MPRLKTSFMENTMSDFILILLVVVATFLLGLLMGMDNASIGGNDIEKATHKCASSDGLDYITISGFSCKNGAKFSFKGVNQ